MATLEDGTATQDMEGRTNQRFRHKMYLRDLSDPDNPVPINLTGYGNPVMELKRKSSEEDPTIVMDAETGLTITDGAAGEVSWNVDLSEVPAGTYVYDLKIPYPDPDLGDWVLLEGSFEVIQGVSR